MPGASPWMLSLLVLGAIVLTLGGARLIRRPHDRARAILMLIAAAILLGNALLWGLPL